MDALQAQVDQQALAVRDAKANKELPQAEVDVQVQQLLHLKEQLQQATDRSLAAHTAQASIS